jgi:hypothetical protein
MSGRDPEELETPSPRLDEILEKFNCEDLLPFCYRIIHLANVKEVLGMIPKYYGVDEDDIAALIILKDESGKKMSADAKSASERSSIAAREMPQVSPKPTPTPTRTPKRWR